MPGKCANHPILRSKFSVGSDWCRTGGEHSGPHRLDSSPSSPRYLLLSLSLLEFAHLRNRHNFLTFVFGLWEVLTDFVQVKCLEQNRVWRFIVDS